MERVKNIINIFMSDPMSFLLLAFIMVSALIVFLGIWKPFFKKFIPNEKLRRAVLAFLSVFLSFASVAITFWVNDWNFDYYVWVGCAFSVWTVFVYWLYESTSLRDGIHFLGSFILKKLSGVDVKTLGDLKNLLKKLKPEIVEAAEPVFNETVSKSSDYVKSKVDDELKKL